MNPEQDLTKLARWGIPGWLAVLTFCVFVLLDIYFNPSTIPPLFDSIEVFFTTFSFINSGYTALAVVIAGVPVGFAIYQIYFFMRWCSPFSRDGLIPPFHLGRMADIQRVTDGFTDDELSKGVPWRLACIQNELFEKDHAFRWRYTELLFTEAAQYLDAIVKSTLIHSRHRYLLEVMHTLGSSMIAVQFSFIAYFFLKFKNQPINFSVYLLILLFLFFFLYFLLNLENKGKEDVIDYVPRREGQTDDWSPYWWGKIYIRPQKFFAQFTFSHSGSFVIVSLGLLTYMGHPLFNTSTDPKDIILQLIIIGSIIVVWIMAKKTRDNKEQYGDYVSWGLALIPGIIMKLVLMNTFIPNLDWSFLLVVFVFLGINLILLQNRHNAKEDILALERYTLRRYLSDDRNLQVTTVGSTSKPKKSGN